MGHVKEPKGVDFFIASDPLTDKARKEISEFISNYKSTSSKKNTKPTKGIKKTKLALT